MYGAGARVGFFQGDIRLLPDDMKTLQPTIFPVVPRLLNRVYDKVSDPRRSTRSASRIVAVTPLQMARSKFLSPTGSERGSVAFQEMAAELRRGEEIR